MPTNLVVRWLIAAVVTIPAAWLIGWGTTRLAGWIALWGWERTAGQPWVERARRAHSARHAASPTIWFAPLAVGVVVGFHLAPSLGIDPRIGGFGAAFMAQLGAFAGVAGLQRRIIANRFDPGVSVADLLLLPTFGPFFLMMALMPATWDWRAGVVLTVGIGLATLAVTGSWFTVLGWFNLVRPAPPRLLAIVAEAASRSGVAPNRTVELRSPDVNALAWPVPRLLAFTGPILEVLDDGELVAVAAHELGHLAEPPGAFVGRIVACYLLVACGTTAPLTASFGPLVGLAPLTILVGMGFVMHRVGRRMEERADQMGRLHEGEDAGTYARALARIHEAMLLPVVGRQKRAIHPHLYDRLVAAGVTPTYDRPAPPAPVRLAALPVLALVLAAAWLIATGS